MRDIGLDVHLDFCEVAVVETGVVRSEGRIETKPQRLDCSPRALTGVAPRPARNALQTSSLTCTLAIRSREASASPAALSARSRARLPT